MVGLFSLITSSRILNIFCVAPKHIVERFKPLLALLWIMTEGSKIVRERCFNDPFSDMTFKGNLRSIL
jgi:hypothetical protein